MIHCGRLRFRYDTAVLAFRYAQGQEAAAVPQLLDEVLSTALERALEPQLLEGMVLERIMSGKQNAL